MERYSGIILNVSYPKIGRTSDIEILGKSMLDWVKIALSGSFTAAVDYQEDTPIPLTIRPYLDLSAPFTVVLYSDTPLITKRSVVDAVAALADNGQNVLKMTRGYVFRTAFLMSVDKIYTENTYYLEEEDFITAFNYRQIQLISDVLKSRIIAFHMENGVYFEDSQSAFVGSDVKIGKNVRIAPNNTILGNTVIGDGVTLKCGNVIENCVIDDGATVDSSRVYKSFIGKNAKVGPFAYIRPESIVGEDCRIGDFVEIKKSVIGKGSKVSHLTYVGDCEMGEGCNVGCGVVFCNYDGKNKHKAIVGNNVFIGSNSNMIAPITIGDGAFIAAGSTLTDSVPNDALAIARARQSVKPTWQGNKFRKE